MTIGERKPVAIIHLRLGQPFIVQHLRGYINANDPTSGGKELGCRIAWACADLEDVVITYCQILDEAMKVGGAIHEVGARVIVSVKKAFSCHRLRDRGHECWSTTEISARKARKQVA
jgi:hypothetical protein